MIRAILFDAVGTLIRPDPSVDVVYCQFGRRFGSKLSRQEIKTRFDNAIREFFPNGSVNGKATKPVELGSTREQQTCSEASEVKRWRNIVSQVFVDVPDARGPLFQELWNHFARGDSWSLYPDVLNSWRQLASRKLTIGIASNLDQRIQRVCAALHPLSQCPHLFWSAQLGYAKPHPMFFQRIERELQLPPREILLIGNDPHLDYLGATCAGWKSLLVLRTPTHVPCDIVPSKHIISSLQAALVNFAISSPAAKASRE